MLSAGQKFCEPLGYAQLPKEVVAKETKGHRHDSVTGNGHSSHHRRRRGPLLGPARSLAPASKRRRDRPPGYARVCAQRGRADSDARLSALDQFCPGEASIRIEFSLEHDSGIRSPVTSARLPFVYGTLVTSALGLLIAVPLGVGAAIFLAELAPRGASPTI